LRRFVGSLTVVASLPVVPNSTYSTPRKHRNPNRNSIIIPTMDPFSAEGELLNIHNLFHQGQYADVVDFDTSALSPENALPARVLSLRAQIALGQVKAVLASVKGQNEPELIAVGALALLVAGEEAKALEIAEALAGEKGDNGAVQVLAGTVLQAAGKSEEALTLLGQHQGNRRSSFSATADAS
jgi:coatomer protein complex subunit epsilon